MTEQAGEGSSRSDARTEPGSAWAIVLAAGEGSRLRALTTGSDGRCVPKQFCSLDGGPTLLDGALARARSVAGPERVVTVVADHHRDLWESALGALPSRDVPSRDVPSRDVIVQPSNRGTAAGVLLPLTAVLARDPRARVAILASDHYVQDEATLRDAFLHALDRLDDDCDDVLLLGITPDAPESDYGWILPERGAGRLRGIRRFVEKPPPSASAELFAQGGLWNSFLLAARGSVLLDLFERRLPGLVDAFRSAGLATDPPPYRAAERLYDELDSYDFSRDVLQGSESHLRVLDVPPCGWTDLGTPQRVAECLGNRRLAGRGPRRRRMARSTPVLTRALRELETGRAPRRDAVGL